MRNCKFRLFLFYHAKIACSLFLLLFAKQDSKINDNLVSLYSQFTPVKGNVKASIFILSCPLLLIVRILSKLKNVFVN